MDGSIVRLPKQIRGDFVVFVNGVAQREGEHYTVKGRDLQFARELKQEGRLGLWRWFLGAWGIGTYGRNDQVDVAWEIDGRPRVAHALEIEGPPDPATP